MKLAADDEQERLAHIATAWKAYNGTLPKPLRVAKGNTGVDDNIQLPLAQVVVDKGRSFLFGEGVRWDTGELAEDANGDPQPARQQKYLDDTWAANGMATLLQNLALSGGISGHAFLRLLRPSTAFGNMVRIINMDPSTVSVIWDQDDIAQVRKYLIRWTTIDGGKACARRQVIQPDEGGMAWTITDERSDADTTGWRPMGEPERWPYPFAPIVDCQNLPAPNTYYGTSDLDSPIVANIQNLDRVLSNASRVLRFHAHPKTVATGLVNADEISTDANGVLILPTGAAITNLEMQSDLSSSFRLADILMDALFTAARIPGVARGKLDSAGALSGVALHILYQPILEKTQDKRRLYGDLLTEANRRILAMGGYGPDNRPSIIWPEIVPTDPASDAATAESLKRVGVSTATLVEQLGYNAEDEAARNADAAVMELPPPTDPLA